MLRYLVAALLLIVTSSASALTRDIPSDVNAYFAIDLEGLEGLESMRPLLADGRIQAALVFATVSQLVTPADEQILIEGTQSMSRFEVGLDMDDRTTGSLYAVMTVDPPEEMAARLFDGGWLRDEPTSGTLWFRKGTARVGVRKDVVVFTDLEASDVAEGESFVAPEVESSLMGFHLNMNDRLREAVAASVQGPDTPAIPFMTPRMMPMVKGMGRLQKFHARVYTPEAGPEWFEFHAVYDSAEAANAQADQLKEAIQSALAMNGLAPEAGAPWQNYRPAVADAVMSDGGLMPEGWPMMMRLILMNYHEAGLRSREVRRRSDERMRRHAERVAMTPTPTAEN